MATIINLDCEEKSTSWISYRREEAIKRLIFMKRKGAQRSPLLAKRVYKFMKVYSTWTKDLSIWSFD